jgi:hypothetical protein
MDTLTILVGIFALLSFISAILFVVFGQVTVRKLRKNPEIKEHLGIEFASGWDIFNVAQALSIPKCIKEKFKYSKVSFLYADADLLYKHTNKFDRFLARVFFFFYFSCGLIIFPTIIMDLLGFFD